MDPASLKKTRWFTGRKLITAIGFVTATVMVYTGKMSDSVWVYSMAVFIAGHHAADLVGEWRKRGD